MPTRYGSISLKNGIWKDSTYPNGVEITKIVEDGVTVWHKDYVGLTYTKLEDHSYSIRAEDTSISGDIKIYAGYYFNDGLARSIENKGFYNCNNITSVDIYGAIESIGNEAFAYCDNLKYVIMPSTVTYIGEDAFLHSPADIYYKGFLDEWNNFIVGLDDYIQISLSNRTYVYAGSNAVHPFPGYGTDAGTLPPPDGFKGYWYYDDAGVPATLCGLYDDFGELNFSVVKETEPTCETPGSNIWTCKECGKQWREWTEPLGHNWSDWFVKDEPTCTKEGTEARYCSRGETIDEWHFEYRPIPSKGGHTWTPATCTTPKTCSVCGVTEGEALGHAWGLPVIDKSPTCTTAGRCTYRCTICNTTKFEVIPATGHNWKAATCTTPKTCSKCGATEGSALGHTKVSYPTVQPTYTTVGYRGGSYCSVCGTVLSERTTILATPLITDITWSDQGCIVDVWIKNNNSLPVTCYVSLYDDDDTGMEDGAFSIEANTSKYVSLSYNSSAVMPLWVDVWFAANGAQSYVECVEVR